MNSAFTIADRMCMLDQGRIIKTGSRQEFEALRDSDPEKLQSQKDKLIRQFLRGDAQGPITDRKISGDYEDDLLMVSVKDEQ
jgi:phospholipid/cholesterol/gamma-HCH transport system ATP-binding protein